MIVVPASWVELRLASRACGSTVHIFADSQFSAAHSAENRFLVPLFSGPDFNIVAGQRNMAIFAGIVNAAAFHFDRDHVRRPMVVLAA